MVRFRGMDYCVSPEMEQEDCERAEAQARKEATALATLGPAARLRRIVEASGPDCTLLEARRHLAEDGQTCTEQEFAAVHRTLFPPKPDWHLPLTTRKEKAVSETNGKLETCVAQNGKLVPATPAEPGVASATSKQIRELLKELGPDIGYEAFADLLAARGYFCSSDQFYRQRCNVGFSRPGSRKKIGQSNGRRLMQSTQTRPREKPAGGKCKVCGCTEADCRGCIKRTGRPCSWVSAARDLCSACLPESHSSGGDLSGLRAEVRRHIGEIDRMIAELEREKANLARYLGGAA
jgi:hypothetical protein